MVGYKGPIYMTVPTKAIAPILLEDMRKVAVDRKGDSFIHLKCWIRIRIRIQGTRIHNSGS